MAILTEILNTEEAFAQLTEQLNGSTKLQGNAESQSAMDAFRKLGIPTQKHEEWKYTWLGKIFKKGFQFNDIATPSPSDILPFLSENDHFRIVLINGNFEKSLSKLPKENGWEIISMQEAIQEQHTALSVVKENETYLKKHALAALNTALFKDGFLIHVKENIKIEKTVLLYNILTDSNKSIVQSKNIIQVAQGASLQIIEKNIHIGKDDVFCNSLTEIKVAENAALHYYKIQDSGNNSYAVDNTVVHQAAESIFSSVVITLSGEIVRNNLQIHLDGKSANAHMYGLYLLNGQQQADNNTVVVHEVPECESNQLYKGILDEASTGVFSGKIVVKQDAQKTNAFQSNKNILLSDEAAAYFRPQLEIFADDVKCSHGATSAQIEDAELFYLRARGIGKEKAKALLMYAFAADVLEQINNADIKAEIEQIIAERLKINE